MPNQTQASAAQSGGKRHRSDYLRRISLQLRKRVTATNFNSFMLSLFIDWAKRAVAKSQELGWQAWVTENEKTGNTSVRLDVDTPTAVARVTFWESGDFHAEVLDLATEKTVYAYFGKSNEEDIEKQLTPFIDFLSASLIR
jgi:hypothetical protein